MISSLLNFAFFTSLLDFFLARIRGSLLTPLMELVSWLPIPPITEANCFRVGWNSTYKTSITGFTEIPMLEPHNYSNSTDGTT